MKRIFLLFTIIGLWAATARTQTIHQSTTIGTPTYYSPNKKQLKPLGDNHFMFLFSTPDINDFLVVYDTELNPIYDIPVRSTGYYAYFEYIPSLHGIIVITSKSNGEKKDKERFEMTAAIYNAEDGEFLKREVLMSDAKELHSARFSDNFEFFSIGPVNESGEFGMHQSGDLALLYTYGLDEEQFDRSNGHLIGNSGSAMFLHLDRAKDLVFDFFFPDTTLNKTVKHDRNLGGGREYNYVSFHQVNDSQVKLVMCRSYKSAVEDIDVWTINTDQGAADKQYSFAVDKDVIREGIYSSFYERIVPGDESALKLVKSVEKRGPKKLKNSVVQHAFFDAEENLYLVFERLDFKTGARSSRRRNQIVNLYLGKDVQLFSIDSEGNYRWGSVYERRARTVSQHTQSEWETPRNHPFHGKWSGVRTFAELKGGSLHLVNYEKPLLGAYGTFYRRFNAKNGELQYTNPLPPGESLVMNINYISMVGEDMVAIIAKEGADYRIDQEEKIKLYTVSLPK